MRWWTLIWFTIFVPMVVLAWRADHPAHTRNLRHMHVLRPNTDDFYNLIGCAFGALLATGALWLFTK